MTDHLHPVLDDAAIARMTSLALAHVGDAVYEYSCARIWRAAALRPRKTCTAVRSSSFVRPRRRKR